MQQVNHIVENNESDRRLIAAVLSGDQAAFSTIIKNTQGLVTQIIFKMIDNREERKDIAQDVYLKAYAKLNGFRYQSKLSTWIAQITYNTCLSYLEKKRLVLAGDLYPSEDEEDAFEHNRSEAPEVENLMFRKEQQYILQTEIDNLPPLFRTLIVLFHQEQLSYDEIAGITGLPAGTLKSYLFRARKTLKTNLLSKYKKEEL
ncbi:MAG: sigma-70 family RNA polymerase sigma factor [Chitinophagaceae bacterium]|nr:MAG: sigma-70 family RNA polymerase sigma factor [Chitinophagaceae bacterium]